MSETSTRQPRPGLHTARTLVGVLAGSSWRPRWRSSPGGRPCRRPCHARRHPAGGRRRPGRRRGRHRRRLGWEQVRTFDGLTSTTYGQLLLAKVGGFLALVAVGWANRSRLVPLAGRTVAPL